MTVAALSFHVSAWAWVALAIAVILIPLAWLSLAPAGRHSRTLAVGLALRTLGIGLLVMSLLDPQWTAPRAVRGANVFAVVADNSQGLDVLEPGAALTRGEELQSRLEEGSRTWMARIAGDFQLRTYVFDRSMRRVRDFGRLDFTGDRSDIGAALKALQERYAGQPLAGVLLLTDGNATDGAPAGNEFAGLAPVYPVVVGESGMPDLRIAETAVRQTAFDDGPVTVRVDLQGVALGARDVSVSILTLGTSGGVAPAPDLPPPARIRLPDNGGLATTTFNWRPTGGGVRFLQVEARTPEGGSPEEATLLNNRRIVMVDRGRAARRILYVGGRPGWEFKFLNRALAEDPQLQMVGLLRVARREPKFEFKGRAGESSNPMFRGFGSGTEEAPRYDQPVLVRVNARDEHELRNGFPTNAGELFAYDAVILDDVEAGFFTTDQLALLRRFSADRGGGLLVLGGADSLDDGNFANSPLAAALPVHLDRRAAEHPRGALRWSLTREGWVEPWTRVRPTEAEERARLQSLPPLFVAHGFAHVKPGATVLSVIEDESGNTFPALVAQPFGNGRVACLATGDIWRWGMKETTDEGGLARTWRQMARWLVTEVPSQVEIRAEGAADGSTELHVHVRDKSFSPLDLARVQVSIRRIDSASAENDDGAGSAFESATLPAEPVRDSPGTFSVRFPGRDPGAYLASAHVTTLADEVVGQAETGWVTDPAREEFRSLEPNRPFLEKIARETGGRVLAWNELDAFAASLPSRSAPIEEMQSQPVWHSAGVFLVVLCCIGAEWLWRRWRGLP